MCKRCKEPVRINAKNYDLYEQMHWICFHFEYEHSAGNNGKGYDPDQPCEAPGCPWKAIKELEKV